MVAVLVWPQGRAFGNRGCWLLGGWEGAGVGCAPVYILLLSWACGAGGFLGRPRKGDPSPGCPEEAAGVRTDFPAPGPRTGHRGFGLAKKCRVLQTCVKRAGRPGRHTRMEVSRSVSRGCRALPLPPGTCLVLFFTFSRYLFFPRSLWLGLIPSWGN